jgi:predicted ATP-grasp superfamily ATP-dependent carboligase
MRVFLYEHITGGGLLAEAAAPSGSLLREGAAMLQAVAEDFSVIPGVQVSVLRDARLASLVASGVCERVVSSPQEHREHFDSASAAVDWTMVIAPEFDRILIDRVRRVEEVGGRLLGPSPPLVELGSSKESTLSHLAAKGIRIPRGLRISAGDPLPESFEFPAVLKPLDGAGSQGIRVAANREMLLPIPGGDSWLEEFQPGTPASVAVLSGPTQRIVMPACRQRLSADGTLSYLGGRLPMDDPLRRRAESLALAVVEELPAFLGYMGIDMVLGESADTDCVIELNPRLTTSYVGLRIASRRNLAAAMLELAQGGSPELCFDTAPVEFSADGKVHAGEVRREQAS